ncbi:hypothetical protein ACFQ0D_17100, partial [Micromonospora zhanjiangensis]
MPSPGDVVRLGREASVQFGGDRALVLRVTVVNDRPTYDGWVWLTGYVLGETGEAIDKREVFVQVAGIQPAGEPTAVAPVARPARAVARRPRRHRADTRTT